MMHFLLKLALLFLCVQAGEGQWLHTLLALDTRGQAASSTPSLHKEVQGGGVVLEEQQGLGRLRGRGGAVRARREAETSCGLHSILIQVRDLGLGYDSDEMVLFKYCGGACPRLPSNHDLTMANLLHSGTLPHTVHWHHSPCCRPTRHEDVVFLDNAHRWHKVEKLSASACTCVG